MSDKDSVLEKQYVEAERPYSQKELENLRQRMRRRLYLGTVLIEHENCGHFYYARANSRKEREARETGQKNVGNCSVCWKINRTPRRLKGRAKDLVDEYCRTLHEDPQYWTYYLHDLESDFYFWLYNEFNPKKELKE
uniref:Uncharacterized protein n=1 Tax=viral metagenome TaxID=1070528 RepID=A0A6C0EKJ4_9ZZZZ